MIDYVRIRTVAALWLLQSSAALAASDISEATGLAKNPSPSPTSSNLVVVFVLVGAVAAILLALVYLRDWHVERLYRARRPRRQPEPATTPLTSSSPRRETIIKRSIRSGNAAAGKAKACPREDSLGGASAGV